MLHHPLDRGPEDDGQHLHQVFQDRDDKWDDDGLYQPQEDVPEYLDDRTQDGTHKIRDDPEEFEQRLKGFDQGFQRLQYNRDNWGKCLKNSTNYLNCDTKLITQDFGQNLNNGHKGSNRVNKDRTQQTENFGQRGDKGLNRRSYDPEDRREGGQDRTHEL